MTSPLAETPQQLAKAIIDSQRIPSPLRTFSSIDEALLARKKSSPNMTDDALRPIVERNLKAVTGGFCWCTDARLRHTSKVRLSEEQVNAFFAAITAPVLVIMAEHGIVPKAWVDKRIQSIKHAELVYLPGHHHFHAEQEAVNAIYAHVKTHTQTN
jgi:hypothetical protein